MVFKIPDKLTFKRMEAVNITKLDGKVIDYWQKEFGGFSPFINQTGEKFYTRKNIETILWIKQLFIVEKKAKEEVKKILNSTDHYHPERQYQGENLHMNKDGLSQIKKSLKEILTILDKNDKK